MLRLETCEYDIERKMEYNWLICVLYVVYVLGPVLCCRTFELVKYEAKEI